MHQEVEMFAGIPQRNPGGEAKTTQNPTTSRKTSLDKPRKEQNRGARTRSMQDPQVFRTRKHHPRHTHLPAEAPQSALTGDACGHSRQRSYQARALESPSPRPWSQLAGSGVGKKHFRNHPPPKKWLSWMLTLISVCSPVPQPRTSYVCNIL